MIANVIAEAKPFILWNKNLKYWWDTLIEDRKLKFGKVQSHSLLEFVADMEFKLFQRI